MAHNEGKGFDNAEHINHLEPTQSIQLTPAHYEKLFLSPETAVKGQLRKTFGNPTPVALAGFLLSNTPACCDLMGWKGAGGGAGNAGAGSGSYFFLGAVLLYAGGIGEFLLGNTFPCVVFFTFGGFWATFGTTLVSSYDTVSGYGDNAAGFYNSFAFFLLCMGILCFIYMIAAVRTNVCLFAILFFFVPTFSCLAASFFYGGHGMLVMSTKLRIAGGAFGFIASMIGWYLWTSMIFESVDLPFSIPVGDLSTRIKGRSQLAADMA